MPTYSLNPNGLLDSGDELVGVTRSIDKALDDLNNYVNQYMGANAGATAEEFRLAQQVWEQGMQQMNQALVVAKQKLDAIVANYGQADAKGAALFEGHV